jgi:hypothetical protein
LKSPRIGELLVAEGVLSRTQLEEALSAQQIYGGRLGTVLVEHGFVHEDDLARLLGRQLGVAIACREDFLNLSPEMLALVPEELASKYSIVPFRYNETRNRVSVAIADPTNLQRADEISFALGRSAEFVLCPEIVLSRALEKYYGIARGRRFIKLDIGHAPAPKPATGKSDARQPPAKREGILGLLINAPTKEGAIDCVLDWLATFGDHAAFLVINDASLATWGARGVARPPVGPLRDACAIQDSRVAWAALAAQGPCGTNIPADDGLRIGLEREIGADCSGRVMLVPLVVHDQAFGLFVVSRMRTGVTPDVTLISELVRRLSFRLQALQLMEQVAAPLAGVTR